MPQGLLHGVRAQVSVSLSALRFFLHAARGRHESARARSLPLFFFVSQNNPKHNHPTNQPTLTKKTNRYEDSCSDSVTARAPFCYVWPPSCPEGVDLQKSTFYPGYFTGFCQVKDRPEASSTRTKLGCQCLQEYRYYEDQIKGGKCTMGRKQLAGKKFCYVDPSTCAPGKAKPSALYEGWFFDLCD